MRSSVVETTASRWTSRAPAVDRDLPLAGEGPAVSPSIATVARRPWEMTRTFAGSSLERYAWCGRLAGESKKTLNTLISGGRPSGALRSPTTTNATGSDLPQDRPKRRSRPG